MGPLILAYSLSGPPSSFSTAPRAFERPAVFRFLLQSWQVLRLYQKANGSCLPRGSRDQAVALQARADEQGLTLDAWLRRLAGLILLATA